MAQWLSGARRQKLAEDYLKKGDELAMRGNLATASYLKPEEGTFGKFPLNGYFIAFFI